MKSLTILLMSLSFAYMGCVTFIPMELNGEEAQEGYYVPSTNPDYVDRFVMTDIFTDNLPSVWGFEKDQCHQFTINNKVKYKGSGCLEMHWSHDPDDCEWIGCGFNWNNWSTIDMSGIEKGYALQFRVKPISGRMGFIPINAVFKDSEDGESVMVNASSKFYPGFGISDEEWTTVTIPLQEFRFEYKGLNTAKIHTLMMSFDGTADIYFDELKIVRTSPNL